MKKIRSRVTLALVACSLLPIVLLVFLSSTVTQHRITEETLDRNAALAGEVGSQVERVLENAIDYLEVLATDPVLTRRGIKPEDRRAEMVRLKLAEFAEINLLDENGLIIESTSKNTEVREYSPWFEKALDSGKVYVSAPILSSETSMLLLSVFLPVKKSAFTDTAVIKANLSFTGISEILDGVNLGPGGSLVLLDRNGNILYNGQRSRLLQKFDSRIRPDQWITKTRGRYSSTEGSRYHYVTESIVPAHQLNGDQRWNLIWFQDSEQILGVVNQTYLYHGATALVAIWGASVMGFFAAGRLSKPIMVVSEAAHKVAEGDLSVRMPDSRIEEISGMSKAFNHMLEELQSTHSKLKDSLTERTDSLLLAETTMAQMRASYEAIGDGLLVVSSDGMIIQMNSKLAEMFSLPSKNYIGMPFADLKSWMRKCALDKLSFDTFWDYYETQVEERGEEEFHTEFPADKQFQLYTAPVRNTVSPKPFARLWLFRDLTEYRLLEEALRQSQKMEAVGQLAGGIAHDFNNLLTGISGNLALAANHLAQSDYASAQPHLETAQGAGDRAAALVKQLLGYSRKSTLDLSVVCLNDLAVETEQILIHTLDRKISIRMLLKDDLWLTECDPNQLQQVFMNLCVNARDAIAGSGAITVRTQNLTITEDDVKERSSDILSAAHAGDYVVISVSDTGAGIAPDQQAKIFEPFYTTKEQGKGTGLGLSMCYGIVKQHGGWIECRSTVDVGSTFKIFIPKSRRSVKPDESFVDLDNGFPDGLKEEQFTILLVDDEPSVRMVAESLLRREGFKIITACNGLEAVRLSRELGDSLHLVILDLTMPVLSGGEAFTIMSEEFPDRPVLICSGYLVDLEKFTAETGYRPTGLMQKPYKLDMMISQVKRVLFEHPFGDSPSGNRLKDTAL